MPWYPPARNLPPALGRAVAALVLAAITFATAHAQDPGERARDGVPIPREVRLQAMSQIKQIYLDFGVPGYAGLAVHPGGHEVDVEAMMAFFKAHLGVAPPSRPSP